MLSNTHHSFNSEDGYISIQSTLGTLDVPEAHGTLAVIDGTESTNATAAPDEPVESDTTRATDSEGTLQALATRCT